MNGESEETNGARDEAYGTLVGVSGVLINSSPVGRGAGRSVTMVLTGGSGGNYLGRRAPGALLKTIRAGRASLLRCLTCAPLNSWRGSVR